MNQSVRDDHRNYGFPTSEFTAVAAAWRTRSPSDHCNTVYVTIKSTDKYFDSKCCGTWQKTK